MVNCSLSEAPIFLLGRGSSVSVSSSTLSIPSHTRSQERITGQLNAALALSSEERAALWEQASVSALLSPSLTWTGSPHGFHG